MMRVSIVSAALCAAATAYNFIPVYQSYQAYPAPNCYRQPILLAQNIAGGRLVAIAEGRNISWCSGTDWPNVIDFPIVARTSVDQGSTWSAPVTFTHGNLDFLTAVVDQSTGMVHLTIQYGDNQTVYWNSPDGASWTGGQQVNIVVPPSVQTIIPGCGHGLQIQSQYCDEAPGCAGTAGTLVLPFVCTTAGDVSNDTACGNCHTCLVTSTDQGQTWTLGALSEQNGSREAALVQLDSSAAGAVGAAIYAGERNLGNNTGSRWHAISVDSGRSFSPSKYATDPSLPDGVTANWTGVVSGMARVDHPTFGPVLVFTAPADRTSRQGMSTWASKDWGQTWTTNPLMLWPGPAAYSDTIALNSTHVGLLFENGDVGTGDFAARISFVAVPVADILAQ